ncbi:S-layer homology domain-containing protein [Brachybacterium sp. GCM10030267]|uniref:S-layer homology domain-containing protein n=1 Tax=unclassified Brachybacterium TaxID=2623841 RepID=UPI003607B156
MSQRNLPPATDSTADSRPRSGMTRRTLFAATAVGVPAATAALSMSPAVADPSVTDGETRILDVPLADYALIDVDGGQARDLPEQPATMVGLTWPADSEAPAVHARGLGQDGNWTPWCELEIAEDPDSGEEAPGTELAWLGVVSALQIRAELDGGDVTSEATAHIVTTSPTEGDEMVGDFSGPYTSQSQSQDLQAQPRMMSTRAAANPATPLLPGSTPSFVARATWGADEGRTGATYGRDELKAVIIHHTAGTNSYSSSESAQIVRGIHTYHTRTLGWADIGYNILVDKYGRIFEGRSGGLHRNIQGAHATGFNRGSFGISVLGHYSSTEPSAAARDAVSRIVAWKLLSTFEERVWSTSTWSSIASGTRFDAGSTQTLAKVMGHRDVNHTECPGYQLYQEFDRIRGDAQYYMDHGWKHHLTAFNAAGGAAKLGTVVRSAYSTGTYWVTVLTKGLVMHRGAEKAVGYVSEVAQEWQPSWGRPTSSVSHRGGKSYQSFENGVAVKSGSSVSFQESRFVDVPPGMMYREEIEELAERGITTGWPDGTYRPLDPIQRDAMVAFVYRALGSPRFTPPSRSPFSDMPPSRMYYKEITWAHAEGIVEGWSDGTFRPTASIERGAVAAFLYRASGRPSSGTSNPFRDVPSNHQFAKEISWLASTGISTGWSDGTFRPVEPIARDAMAAFMIRWMEERGL